MNRKAWIEALQYIFLLVLVLLNIISLTVTLSNTNKVINSQRCIAEFFLLPSRATTTIKVLPGCEDVVKSLSNSN